MNRNFVECKMLFLTFEEEEFIVWRLLQAGLSNLVSCISLLYMLDLGLFYWFFVSFCCVFFFFFISFYFWYLHSGVKSQLDYLQQGLPGNIVQ